MSMDDGRKTQQPSCTHLAANLVGGEAESHVKLLMRGQLTHPLSPVQLILCERDRAVDGGVSSSEVYIYMLFINVFCLPVSCEYSAPNGGATVQWCATQSCQHHLWCTPYACGHNNYTWKCYITIYCRQNVF